LRIISTPIIITLGLASKNYLLLGALSVSRFRDTPNVSPTNSKSTAKMIDESIWFSYVFYALIVSAGQDKTLDEIYYY